jgi:hypothetical protein
VPFLDSSSTTPRFGKSGLVFLFGSNGAVDYRMVGGAMPQEWSVLRTFAAFQALVNWHGG